MDSSPDLSLKLRRGSSDSRDSFYMDFAQGIDSDIEVDRGDVGSPCSGPLPMVPPHAVSEAPPPVPEHMAPPPEPMPPPVAVTVVTVPNTCSSVAGVLVEVQEEEDDEELPSPPPTPPPPPPPLRMDDSSILESCNQKLVPSPSSPSKVIVSCESLSHHSSPARSSRVLLPSSSSSLVAQPQSHHQHHVTIDESIQTSISLHHHMGSAGSYRGYGGGSSIASSPVPPFQPYQELMTTPTPTPTGRDTGTSTTTQHLAVLYHSTQQHHVQQPTSILTPMRRASRLPEIKYISPPPKEIRARDALATTLSALYGKLLVVMGIAFPMAEVISTYIPPSFYESFYLYLYIGSMVFLLFMYATMLWGRPKAASTTTTSTQNAVRRKSTRHISSCSSDDDDDSGDDSDQETGSSSRPKPQKISMPSRRSSILAAAAERTQHYGSFYLRMGAVAFGIGSMIYSGLEFGQYFELERDTKCHNVLLALTPATRMAFIFIQMYFIFLNNEVYRHKVLARFGLMHMVGTNLSVWFSVLIQETKHEILTFYDPENGTLRISHRLGNKVLAHQHHHDMGAHLRVARGLKGPHNIFECRRSNIIGTLVQDASPFLFPCTIEYSLICAAILYVMWRNVCRPLPEIQLRTEVTSCKRSPHHYSVDCARAHKGLFLGILMLVLTIISLILFFVLISRSEFIKLAVFEVNICELVLYGTTTLACCIGMFQVRRLQYDAERSFSLDDILLVGAQTGSFLYSTFTVIGGHFTMRKDTILVLITALASLVETATQTMFILNAGRRSAATAEHIRKKPGREIVTFLLVSNLAMWAINTLEKSRAESHPIQLNFYGLWAWTIITHVSMPLAIFYRFHSTVCLCEIWKRAYKMKPAYM